MGSGSWLLRRVLPCLGATVALTICAGALRGAVIFLPGLTGMAVGGALGWLCGRLGRDDPPAVWPFATRGGLTLGATLLYGLGSLAVVAAIHAGSTSFPSEWLTDALQGRAGELFAGISTNSYQSVSGTLHGGWWVLFVLVDALLFAFLHLVMLGVGLGPVDEDLGEDEEPALAPVTPAGAPPLGRLSLAAYAAAAVVLVGAASTWPTLAVLAGAEAPVRAGVSELQGEWSFVGERPFFVATDDARSFTLSRGLGEEIACTSATDAQYMIILEARRDGSYAGHLLLPGARQLPVTMHPSRDLGELRFAIRGLDRRGQVREIPLVAVRTDP